MDLFHKLRKLSLLLVEDDKWIRDSLKLFFESEGCRIITVESAEAGLDAVKRRKFDIIMIDYRLPGVNGIEFKKRLPENRRDALTVLITSDYSKEVISRAHAAGIDETICKPFSSEDIERSLKRIVRLEDTTQEYQQRPAPDDPPAIAR